MPKKRENFSQSNLTAAVEAVVNEGLSKKFAAKKFSVSRSTLQYRLKNPDQKVSCGPAPVLSEEEEKTLEKWILESSRKGFPQRKDDLLISVKQYLDKNERTTIFKNNYPGIGWYKSFMKRHPNISVRTRVDTSDNLIYIAPRGLDARDI
ncbi:uncharacterized protein LOC107883396 [Acyrthosiphon pisum]|uniref:HTH CENPB-type domain-containing protein n=1 Tax=Acyrthosiphon pisum TaxID=7029 RepID=A0A8R2D3Z1_ACYPI|nr:uncharacterized protein LOC107883396 [Acyrthosiphon pisum]|eukprot:XP_016658809.1 PREDICTED: uncharacterized protein LOC107883396 [Acyrthosiphon pisum]